MTKKNFDDNAKHAFLLALYRHSSQSDLQTGITATEALQQSYPGWKRLDKEKQRSLRNSATILIKKYFSKYNDDVELYHGAKKYSYPAYLRDEEKLARCTFRWKLNKPPKILDKNTQDFKDALIKKFTPYFLPEIESESISNIELNKKSSQGMRWLKKIDFEPRYAPLYLNYDETAFAKLQYYVLDALKKGKGFKARVLSDEEKVYFPISFLRRERISYIRCVTDKNKDKTEEVAIHRLQLPDDRKAQKLIDPSSFGVAIGALDVEHQPRVSSQWGLLAKLVLEINGDPAQHLSEVRFHPQPEKHHLTEHQILKQSKKGRVLKVRLTIRNIEYTYELKCWILGLGKYCQLLEAIPYNQADNIDVFRDLRDDVNKMYQNLNT